MLILLIFIILNFSNLQTSKVNKSLYQIKQDSIRNVVLKSKENYMLKNSILQEFYIRNLVNEVDSKLEFELPFNLHSLDCLAPDCYITNIKFNISAKYPITFPNELELNINESGCGIEKENNNNVKFTLVENLNDSINYYSEELKSNLVILLKEKKLYYFPKSKNNLLKISQIDSLFLYYNDEDLNYNIPYRASIFESYEYENFIK